MPNDDSMPSLVRYSSTQTPPAQIKLHDHGQARVASSAGGVPPMFQAHSRTPSEAPVPERLPD